MIFQVFIFLGTVLIAVGGFGVYLTEKNREREKENVSKYVGVIGNQTKTIFSFDKNKIPKIQIGDKGPIFQGDFNLFKRLGLEVKMIKGQIKVSACVNDQDGNVVATIIDNEWKINPNQSYDRNYSIDALEVIDNSGNIVLQVRFAQDVLQFQGILYDSQKRLFWLVAQRERDGRMDGFMEIQKPGNNFSYSIKPIFKYPSELHLGVYNN